MFNWYLGLFVFVIFHNRFQTFSFSAESTVARAIS